jgi:hypothetical protein
VVGTARLLEALAQAGSAGVAVHVCRAILDEFVVGPCLPAGPTPLGVASTVATAKLLDACLSRCISCMLAAIQPPAPALAPALGGGAEAGDGDGSVGDAVAPDPPFVCCVGVDRPVLVLAIHLGSWGHAPSATAAAGQVDARVCRAWTTPSGIENPRARRAIVVKVHDLIGVSPGITEHGLHASLAMILTRVDLKMLLMELVRSNRIVAKRMCATAPPGLLARNGVVSGPALLHTAACCIVSENLAYFPVARHAVGGGWGHTSNV